MHIEREARKVKQVPLTPLIDVVFLLLVFFMLSSTFTRTESLELMLPKASSGQVASEGQLLQVYVSQDGSIFLGREKVNETELVKRLSNTFKLYPDSGILLLSGPRVSVQQLVGVMDHIYLAGSTNLSVAAWEPDKVEAQAQDMKNDKAVGADDGN